VDAAARIAELEAKLARAAHERDEYRKLYELVLLELERVKRHLRAQNKSERVDAEQVQMAFRQIADLILPPALAEQIAASENDARDAERAAQGQPRRGPHGRNKLPEHLPLERIEIHPPEALRQCACCGKAMHTIGEETSEQLDYRPASLVRVQTARIKYACACEQGGVVVASRSDGRHAPVVERGLAAPGLLAHVVVSKYADHLPLHRMEERFAREGVHLPRSTLCDWVAQVADLLGPITDAMGKAMLGAHRIHTDDTGIPVQAQGRTQKGHVWTYVADDADVVFRYTPRRKSDGPREFLHGYKGYVQADAANLYDRLYSDGKSDEGGAIEVGCWAHYPALIVIRRVFADRLRASGTMCRRRRIRDGVIATRETGADSPSGAIRALGPGRSQLVARTRRGRFVSSAHWC